MGSDTRAHGFRQRLKLARAVPESLLVCRTASFHALITDCCSHLRPGYGWIEQIEVDLEPRCDNGTLPPNSYLKQWYGFLQDATQRCSRPIAYQQNTRQMLQQAGFIDIQETIIRAPYNSWPGDPHQKEIGRWYNLGLTEGLEAISLAPFHRAFGWDAERNIKPFVAQVKREVCSRKIHAYNNM